MTKPKTICNLIFIYDSPKNKSGQSGGQDNHNLKSNQLHWDLNYFHHIWISKGLLCHIRKKMPKTFLILCLAEQS